MAGSLVVTWCLWHVTHKGSRAEQQLEQPKLCLSREQMKQSWLVMALRISQDSLLKGSRREPPFVALSTSLRAWNASGWVSQNRVLQKKQIKMFKLWLSLQKGGQSQSNFTVWRVLLVPSPLLPLSLQRKAFSLDSSQKIYVSQIYFLIIKYYLAFRQVLLLCLICRKFCFIAGCWSNSVFRISAVGSQLRTSPNHNECYKLFWVSWTSLSHAKPIFCNIEIS